MTDDGGQRAEGRKKSEVGSRRSEDRGKKVGGWRSASLEVGGKRKTIADCGLRIANLQISYWILTTQHIAARKPLPQQKKLGTIECAAGSNED